MPCKHKPHFLPLILLTLPVVVVHGFLWFLPLVLRVWVGRCNLSLLLLLSPAVLSPFLYRSATGTRYVCICSVYLIHLGHAMFTPHDYHFSLALLVWSAKRLLLAFFFYVVHSVVCAWKRIHWRDSLWRFIDVIDAMCFTTPTRKRNISLQGTKYDSLRVWSRWCVLSVINAQFRGCFLASRQMKSMQNSQ